MKKVLPLGVSQISGASKTSVGGYADPEAEKNAEATSEQFDVSDQRTLDEVVNWLMKMDYIPSSVQPATERAERETVLWHCARVCRYLIAVIRTHS